ncbi:MAG: hypothetical protein ACFFBP_19385 [Promethearchaeota archaeon]
MGITFESNYRITLGVNVFIKNIELFDGEIATLSFWDICEKETFKFFRKSLYRGAMGAVIAFDLSDAECYRAVKDQIKEIHEELITKIPYVLIGVDKGKIDESLDLTNIKRDTEENGGIFIELSDYSDEIFIDALTEMTQKIVNSKMVMH